jgi:hypothetical protein
MASKYRNDMGDLPPEEDALERWCRLQPKPEPPPRQRRLDTAEPDWSAWNNWCDSRIDARRCFDREVLVELVAELKGMIEDQDEKLKVQAESIRSLELKLAELVVANDLRSAEDRHASAKLAKHQIADCRTAPHGKSRTGQGDRPAARTAAARAQLTNGSPFGAPEERTCPPTETRIFVE